MAGFVHGYCVEHRLTDFVLTENQLTLYGSVSDEATRDSVGLWAATVFNGGVQVDNQLRVGIKN